MALSTEINCTACKLRVMFYSAGILRTRAQEAASQIPLRDCSAKAREGPGYTGVFATKTR